MNENIKWRLLQEDDENEFRFDKKDKRENSILQRGLGLFTNSEVVQKKGLKKQDMYHKKLKQVCFFFLKKKDYLPR